MSKKLQPCTGEPFNADYGRFFVCPLRNNCERYAHGAKPKGANYLNVAPYDKETNTCSMLVESKR